MQWKMCGRTLTIDRSLVMGILNVTPDSFSDGGNFLSVDNALRRAEQIINDGADIIDVGGESTRPGSVAVPIEEEVLRVVPAIEAILKRSEIPTSVDTTKSEVAAAAIDAGAEIINDISGLRFDAQIAAVAARARAGLVLMHSRGEFEAMHSQPPVNEIMSEVVTALRQSIDVASKHGVMREQIVVDPGIGFGKTAEQNLELLAKLDKIVTEFDGFPVLVGASRKSFLGKLTGDAPADQRLGGSLAAALVAVQKGANIVRVHDVKETVGALRILAAADMAK